MITEQYVSFETAKMLKEAGFDSPTRGIYRTNRTGDHSFAEYNMKQTVDDLSWNAKDGFQYEYLAPTQSLAARWLREVYNIHISVFPDTSSFEDGACVNKNREYVLSWFVFKGDKVEYHYAQPFFNSFESALEAGIQEALRLIIKNKGYGQRND